MNVKPKHLVKFNLIATGIWVLLIAPTLLFWKDSILWVAVMSVWANIAAHFSAYIAARSEQEANDNQRRKKRSVDHRTHRQSRRRTRDIKP